MATDGEKKNSVKEAYREGAPSYDQSVETFNLFRWMGFDLPKWRLRAIHSLSLMPGDTVVDVGCGTGLNFPLIMEQIGPGGSIIGVDLSESMLEEAERRVKVEGWDNVDLICEDAATLVFPESVQAVLSTFVMILVPKCDRVVNNAIQALEPGGRMAILDMAWPKKMPLWWRHVLFFLKSYGVDKSILVSKPWIKVQMTMAEKLEGYTQEDYWYGFFYLATGEKGDSGNA